MSIINKWPHCAYMTFEQLYKSFETHSSRVAFCINDIFYTYKELWTVVAKIRALIRKNIDENEQIIGLIAHNDLETYASIIALWFEGKAYLSLLQTNPVERNKTIIQQANINTILSSHSNEKIENICFFNTTDISYNPIEEQPKEVPDNLPAYILFTDRKSVV